MTWYCIKFRMIMDKAFEILKLIFLWVFGLIFKLFLGFWACVFKLFLDFGFLNCFFGFCILFGLMLKCK